MPSYKKSELETLKRDVPAWQAIGQRIRLLKMGSEYKACCPFHKEDTPSFTVFEKDGSWLWKCFGCQKSGNVFQFIQEFDNVDFDSAVEKVAQLAGWLAGKRSVDSSFRPVAEATEKALHTFPVEKMVRYEADLESCVEAVHFLNQRGISLETAKRMHLGYTKNAASISMNHPQVDGGWIVFPYIEGSDVRLMKLRSIKVKDFLRVKNMATLLYNRDTVEAFSDVMVVEGEFDALVLEQAGFPAVALPDAGYKPSPEERDLLMQANCIYLAGDADAVGAAAMDKLWAELRDRTYRIRWPEGCKDANDFLLKVCGGDYTKFESGISELKNTARQNPIPHFYGLKGSLLNADDTDQMSNPLRMRMPWKPVDEMAVITPGQVVSVYATYSGSGKTTWMMAVLVEEAIKRQQVIVNYSAELSPQEYAMLVCSYLTKSDKLALTRADYNEAARQIGDSKFYVGYNPDANRIGEVLDLMEWAIRRLGATIVCLDHLHFLCRNEADSIKAQENAMQRIKNMAVKYGVVFIVVGQSRKAPQQTKGRPSEASDAKGSETFISDANTVFHIHRELRRDIDWSNPPADLLSNETDIRLYKARTKGPGNAIVRLLFKGSIARFHEMTSQTV